MSKPLPPEQIEAALTHLRLRTEDQLDSNGVTVTVHHLRTLLKLVESFAKSGGSGLVEDTEAVPPSQSQAPPAPAAPASKAAGALNRVPGNHDLPRGGRRSPAPHKRR